MRELFYAAKPVELLQRGHWGISFWLYQTGIQQKNSLFPTEQAVCFYCVYA